MSATYAAAHDLVLRATQILLLTDERIDGDTMGSTLAFFHVLKKLNKEVTIFSPKPLPKQLSYLPGIEHIVRDPSLLERRYDLAIVCDSSDGAYLKELFSRLSPSLPLVSFDHHGDNLLYGQINIIEPAAASTADIVWRFLTTHRYPITPEAAHCLLTGICTDTMLFANPNTTADAITISGELIRLGANLKEIVLHNFMNHSVSSLKLWGLALERLFFDETVGGVATVITLKDIEEHKATEDDVGGITNFLNALLDESHEVVAVYRETPDGGVKGGLRSRGKDVAALAARLYGGGGHKLAAGFKVPNAKLVEESGKWRITRQTEHAL